jgi:hypothetical protein
MSGRSTPVTTNNEGGSKPETGESAPASAPTVEAPPPPPAEGEGEAQLLVSEFPPPPYYYTLVTQQYPDGSPILTPPPIPYGSLKVAAKKAAQMAEAAAKAAEAERFASLGASLNSELLGESGATEGGDGSNAVKQEETSIKIDGSGTNQNKDDDIDGDVVAVFGEIVEDPMLIEIQDECDDPKVIQDRLNA